MTEIVANLGYAARRDTQPALSCALARWQPSLRSVLLSLASGVSAMTIKVGETIPSLPLRIAMPDDPREATTDEIFWGKRVVLFAVPGAFTPACSKRHMPGYV